MADEQNEDDFDDLSLPDFDEELEKAAKIEEESEEESIDLTPLSDLIEEEEEEAAPAAAAPKKAEPSIQAAPAPIEGSRDDLNFSLTVEVGRVSIPLSKLLDMEEGSIVELGVSSEQGVDLVVGGRCIGRGELMKIGPKIAVRILSIK